MFCHNVCNQTSPCLLYELDCAVWGIFFVWTFLGMFHTWISSLHFFLFPLCHTLTGVSANYLSVCKHSHTCHTQICFPCEFSCALQAHPLPHLCHKHSTFQLCAHFQCASSKYMLCGTFCHRCYRWTRFFGGILCYAFWGEMDCWILFHNRHIAFECSLLKVWVTTDDIHNIQNSEYFRQAFNLHGSILSKICLLLFTFFTLSGAVCGGGCCDLPDIFFGAFY